MKTNFMPSPSLNLYAAITVPNRNRCNSLFLLIDSGTLKTQPNWNNVRAFGKMGILSRRGHLVACTVALGENGPFKA